MRVKTYPTKFYEKIYEQRIRRVHSKIELLNWEEQSIGAIDGIVTGGTYNADGSSNARRNLTLTMSTRDRDDELVFDYLNLNTKIALYIGLENNTKEFEEDKVIWFNMGIYILTEPAISHEIDMTTLSIACQDKMSMMNGVIGGKLTAPVSFTQIIDNNEKVSLSWREIFLNAASLFGNENPARVIVDSVPEYIREFTQVKSVGGLHKDFIHVDEEEEVKGERIIVNAWSPGTPESKVKFSEGDRLYKLRRFGPADPSISATNTQEDYIKNTGEPITSIFEDIKESLSHTHEYFYSRNGDLVFQPIKNFINERFNPDESNDYGYFSYELEMDDFQPNFSGLPFVYNFADKNTVVSYNNIPSWLNIKNDFVVTGKNGQSLEVAIDDRPSQKEIQKWFVGLARDFNQGSSEMKFIQKDGIKRECYNPRTNTVPFEYKPAYKGANAVYVDVPLDRVPWQIAHGIKNYYIRNIWGGGNHKILPRWGRECESMIFKWNLSIDEKFLKPNTGIFNPSLIGMKTPWLAGYPISIKAGTEDDNEQYDTDNPIFTSIGDPAFWMYYLDIIDTRSQIGRYSISLIGKRPETLNMEQATTLFRTNPKELVVITESELASLGGDYLLIEMEQRNQSYAVIKDLSEQMYLPADAKLDRSPYTAFAGNPSNGEQLFYGLPSGTGQSITYNVGGRYSGEIYENTNNVGEQFGTLLITKGTYKHPISKATYTQTENATINTPLGLGTDSTEFAFLAYIENKGGRCPNSGSHKNFAVIKHVGGKWSYASNNVWVPFIMNRDKDALVGVLEQNVYSGDGYVSGSGQIDYFAELFTLRDSKMSNLFSIDGGVDCFSGVRSMIYQHTNFAEVITIKCLPVYHLEPNTLIYVEDEDSNISGTFMITNISISFQADSGEPMTINAIRTTPRI